MATDLFGTGRTPVFKLFAWSAGSDCLKASFAGMRSGTREGLLSLITGLSEREEKTIEDADISALDQLAEKDIIRFIQELSPGYKTVFNLYVVEGYSHREIADMLGISEGTSKSQLARAKGILQKKVTQYLSETKKTFSR